MIHIKKYVNKIGLVLFDNNITLRKKKGQDG